MGKPVVLLAIGLLLAGTSGFLTSQAFSRAGAGPRTTTINVATGETGPRGPAGPQGPAGLACPAGYSPGKLVINHPGGQTAVWTCLED